MERAIGGVGAGVGSNKGTIERYMEGFRLGDHAMVLDCLDDEVEWIIPGMFHVKGKAAFEEQIENEHFIGHPRITIFRMVEENDVVIAEGAVSATKIAGGELRLIFCDAFTMKQFKVRRLVSYLMEVK